MILSNVDVFYLQDGKVYRASSEKQNSTVFSQKAFLVLHRYLVQY